MIPIILLIVSLLQVAFCSPLAVQDSGCITHPDIKPIANSCHQVIDAFSQKDPSGYITLAGQSTLTIIKGGCEGTLYNRKSEGLRINEATLAVEMTTNIFNKCVINGMWGRWETNDYSIRLLPLAFQQELGKIKRDSEVPKPTPGTTCLPSDTVMVNPVDCSEAIIVLYNKANPVGMIRVNAYSCVYGTVRSCSAYVCNMINGPWNIEATSVKYHLENFVYDPCITKGQYGYWNDKDGRVNVQIGQVLP